MKTAIIAYVLLDAYHLIDYDKAYSDIRNYKQNILHMINSPNGKIEFKFQIARILVSVTVNRSSQLYQRSVIRSILLFYLFS